MYSKHSIRWVTPLTTVAYHHHHHRRHCSHHGNDMMMCTITTWRYQWMFWFTWMMITARWWCSHIVACRFFFRGDAVLHCWFANGCDGCDALTMDVMFWHRRLSRCDVMGLFLFNILVRYQTNEDDQCISELFAAIRNRWSRLVKVEEWRRQEGGLLGFRGGERGLSVLGEEVLSVYKEAYIFSFCNSYLL